MRFGVRVRDPGFCEGVALALSVWEMGRTGFWHSMLGVGRFRFVWAGCRKRGIDSSRLSTVHLFRSVV